MNEQALFDVALEHIRKQGAIFWLFLANVLIVIAAVAVRFQ